MDKLDPMQNQLCKVCDEPAAGFHFGAFTCEGCKSFFGRTCNNQSVIQECKNNYRCVINKKNRTACKACRLTKCLRVGMSKSGSRYGRRSNWFKIHCLMQQQQQAIGSGAPPPPITPASVSMPDRPSSGPASPASLTTPPPTLWRPLEAASPRSVHSESSRSGLKRSPSHSPMSSTENETLNPTLLLERHLKAAAAAAAANGHAHLPSEPRPPPPVTTSSPDLTTSPSLASITPRLPANLYSPFASGLPFLPPTFNLPALASLPIHKQMLLSPLLASSQMLAAAAASRKAYPFPFASPNASEENDKITDILSEHKALLERFRSLQQQQQLLEESKTQEKLSESPKETSNLLHKSTELKSGVETNDRCSSRSSRCSMGSEIIPNLSDTDPEDETTAAEVSVEVIGGQDQKVSAQTKKRHEEAPLDLTCA